MLISPCSVSFLISFLIDFQSSGIFTLSQRFAQIIVLFSIGFQFSWQEFVFASDYSLDNFIKNKIKSQINQQFFIMALSLIIMIPGIRFFFVFFPNFLGNNFDLVINFIPYTFISAVFSILGNFSATVLISQNKNNDVFISTLIGAIVNISTTTLLIYFGLGLFSAYIGLIAGFLTTYIKRNLRLKHFFQINVPFKFIFILVIFSIVLINLINLL